MSLKTVLHTSTKKQGTVNLYFFSRSQPCLIQVSIFFVWCVCVSHKIYERLIFLVIALCYRLNIFSPACKFFVLKALLSSSRALNSEIIETHFSWNSNMICSRSWTFFICLRSTLFSSLPTNRWGPLLCCRSLFWQEMQICSNFFSISMPFLKPTFNDRYVFGWILSWYVFSRHQWGSILFFLFGTHRVSERKKFLECVNIADKFGKF